jgi:hypothetical protein
VKNNSYKVQLTFSVIMVVLVIALLTVIKFVFNGLDMTSYIFIDIALLIWPVSIYVSYSQFKNAAYAKQGGKAPVKRLRVSVGTGFAATNIKASNIAVASSGKITVTPSPPLISNLRAYTLQ